MNEHKYILEPYKGMKTRYQCPSCQQRDKTFVRYLDTETGQYLHDDVGRCNRIDSCGYHYTPKQYFQDNNISFDKNSVSVSAPLRSWKQEAKPQPFSYIPFDTFNASLRRYETNNFISYLVWIFGTDVTESLIKKYYIGTSRHWNGATVFWQIDKGGKIRTGKIMLYNPETGKRVKDSFNHITWVHITLNQPNYELKQCLFGEHLLKDTQKPIAIVESEKTAIIANVCIPQFIWLAAGSLTNINTEKCSVLKGRNVTLFPDLNGFEKWSNKAQELSHIASFTVSDLLERKATEDERQHGLDLADYLIRFDYKEFTTRGALTPIERLYRELEKVSIEFCNGEMSIDDYCTVSNRIHTQVKANNISLRDFVRFGTIKQSFKEEFLNKPVMSDNEQVELLRKYRGIGLHPKDAKDIINELLNENGFALD